MAELFTNCQTCLKEFGPPYDGDPLLTKEIKAYKDRLPETFLDFWQAIQAKTTYKQQYNYGRSHC